jgi:predicted amidophosphoribosyltransferase
MPTALMTAVGHVQICKECGKAFGSEEKVCWVCHAHICPHCGMCNCYAANKSEKADAILSVLNLLRFNNPNPA